jgi:hypothetical protein
MEETNLSEVLNWLDAKQKPLIAILPVQVYSNIKAKWKLPDVHEAT